MIVELILQWIEEKPKKMDKSKINCICAKCNTPITIKTNKKWVTFKCLCGMGGINDKGVPSGTIKAWYMPKKLYLMQQNKKRDEKCENP